MWLARLECSMAPGYASGSRTSGLRSAIHCSAWLGFGLESLAVQARRAAAGFSSLIQGVDEEAVKRKNYCC